MPEQVSPLDVDQGDELTMHWSPAGWAHEAGFDDEVGVTVQRIRGPQRENSMTTIVLDGEDGNQYEHAVDGGHIQADVDDPPPGRPHFTEVGRFRKYETR